MFWRALNTASAERLLPFAISRPLREGRHRALGEPGWHRCAGPAAPPGRRHRACCGHKSPHRCGRRSPCRSGSRGWRPAVLASPPGSDPRCRRLPEKAGGHTLAPDVYSGRPARSLPAGRRRRPDGRAIHPSKTVFGTAPNPYTMAPIHNKQNRRICQEKFRIDL